MNARVAALFVHPLKSGAAVPVATMEFDALGAVNDRRWLLVDSSGVALTQRECPALSRVAATAGPHSQSLVLRAPGFDVATAAIDESAGHVRVNIWNDVVDALDAGNDVAAWCTSVVGTPCRLVCIDPLATRPLAPKYAGSIDPTGRRVAFTDGSPALLLSVASIAALNERLAARGHATVGVDRFRPNILLDGVPAHAEDTWLDITIGDMRFGVGTSCPRCVMTTVDQERGERAGPEPLHMLSTYRRAATGVMFGVNATHERAGIIRVGDVVRVVAVKQTM